MSTPPLKLKRSVPTRLLDQLPWYPQWRSLLVKLLYWDEWVLKVWGSELCFINAAMNSHTTVWCNKKKTWNRRCYPLLIPCIIGHFFSMTMKIFFLPSLKSFSGHVFHSILTHLSCFGGFCIDELKNSPLKTRALKEVILQELNRTDVKICQTRTQCQEGSKQYPQVSGGRYCKKERG